MSPPGWYIEITRQTDSTNARRESRACRNRLPHSDSSTFVSEHRLTASKIGIASSSGTQNMEQSRTRTLTVHGCATNVILQAARHPIITMPGRSYSQDGGQVTRAQRFCRSLKEEEKSRVGHGERCRGGCSYFRGRPAIQPAATTHREAACGEVLCYGSDPHAPSAPIAVHASLPER